MLVVTNRNKLKRLGRIFLVILVITLVVTYFMRVVIPLVTDMANAEVKSIVVNKVNEVLFEGKDPHEAVNELMLRDSKAEHMAVEWKE